MMKWLWQKFKDAKIRHKIIIMFFFIGVIPMVILGMYSYTEVRRLLIVQEKNNMADYLNQAVMSADNQLQIYNNLSEYISYNETVAQVLTYDYGNYYEMYERYTKVLDPLLSSVKYFNDGVKQLTIYADNPALVKHDITIDRVEAIEENDWYTDTLKTDSRDIKWMVQEDSKDVFSVRKMPAIQNEGSTAILYVEVDYDKLFESFENMSGDQYGVYIVDQADNVVFQKISYDKDSKEQILKVSDIEQATPICQDYAIVCCEMLSDWTVWFYKPNRVINASVTALVVAILVVMIFCIVFSVIGATILSKIILIDIENLTKNMEAVEQGDIRIMVTSESKDEVGNLIRGFGSMINRINQLINEVYKGKISQKESEMRALQAQINPHFLYNSLSLINWKAIETNQKDISKLTLLLSTFYRTALNRGKNVLSIRDEIRNMDSYLEIQLMMHDYNFSVVRNVDEDILEYKTLNLILQTLIENAIDHGIDMKENGEGIITISGCKNGSHILLSVEDNGIGMDEATAASILTKESKGYGVRNVNERIMLYYGEAYHLTVESKQGEGTKITICIPQIRM